MEVRELDDKARDKAVKTFHLVGYLAVVRLSSKMVGLNQIDRRLRNFIDSISMDLSNATRC